MLGTHPASPFFLFFCRLLRHVLPLHRSLHLDFPRSFVPFYLIFSFSVLYSSVFICLASSISCRSQYIQVLVPCLSCSFLLSLIVCVVCIFPPFFSFVFLVLFSFFLVLSAACLSFSFSSCSSLFSLLTSLRCLYVFLSFLLLRLLRSFFHLVLLLHAYLLLRLLRSLFSSVLSFACLFSLISFFLLSVWVDEKGRLKRSSEDKP